MHLYNKNKENFERMRKSIKYYLYILFSFFFQILSQRTLLLSREF